MALAPSSSYPRTMANRAPICHGDVNEAVLGFISSLHTYLHIPRPPTMPPSGAQKDYCRYKVNGKKCPDAHDQTNRSHNQGRIQWWIKNQKDKPCKAQRPCLNFEGGLCLFSHPPDEVKWQDERQQLMSRDTELLEVLDLPPVLQSGGTTSEGDCLGVRDCTQLCTFSTIDECNIAIPGV